MAQVGQYRMGFSLYLLPFRFHFHFLISHVLTNSVLFINIFAYFFIHSLSNIYKAPVVCQAWVKLAFIAV